MNCLSQCTWLTSFRLPWKLNLRREKAPGIRAKSDYTTKSHGFEQRWPYVMSQIKHRLYVRIVWQHATIHGPSDFISMFGKNSAQANHQKLAPWFMVLIVAYGAVAFTISIVLSDNGAWATVEVRNPRDKDKLGIGEYCGTFSLEYATPETCTGLKWDVRDIPIPGKARDTRGNTEEATRTHTHNPLAAERSHSIWHWWHYRLTWWCFQNDLCLRRDLGTISLQWRLTLIDE